MADPLLQWLFSCPISSSCTCCACRVLESGNEEGRWHVCLEEKVSGVWEERIWSVSNSVVDCHIQSCVFPRAFGSAFWPARVLWLTLL